MFVNHVDTRGILPTYEDFCVVYKENGIQNKNIFKYPCHVSIKICEILVIDTRMVSKEEPYEFNIGGQFDTQ